MRISRATCLFRSGCAQPGQQGSPARDARAIPDRARRGPSPSTFNFREPSTPTATSMAAAHATVAPLAARPAVAICLGGKGANLAEMSSIGLSVPAGFTVTTEVCAQFHENAGELARGPGTR